jgi:crotonobetainyl-CoA:carnitine CoA-transferase CaiB-like acyl-CoA transferase
VSPGPLNGLRILDCSRGTAGPRATALLADYGAEVVWLEPAGGDPLRRMEPATVSAFSRGKLSVTVDLQDPAERAVLLGACGGFDVFVESGDSGASRLGLGYDEVSAANPAIIYCSISGFGAEGRYASMPEREALVHALVGTMADQAGHREGPIFQGLPFASIGAGYLAAIGVLGALYRRNVDGRGRLVETSLFDGALAYLSMLWGETDESVAGRGPGEVSLRRATSGTRLVTRTFECADGLYIGIHTGAVGAFGRFMKVLGLDDRIPPSPDGMDIGKPLSPEQQAILNEEPFRIFRTKPRSYWVDMLMEADVCAIEHLPPTEVFDEPQARHNELVVELDDPALGRVQQVAPAARFATTPPGPPGSPPLAGQHGRGAGAIPAGTPWATVAAADVPGDERPLLEGVTVLDLGAYYAGPYSSRLLADLGADVIKLEPTRGDQLRGLERPFFSAQAGKRSIAADLKAPDLRPAVAGLLRWADIVHHNLRPGAAERLGLDYESVTAINPAVVYVYAPGWGSTGPHRSRQSFAPMLSGYVGVTFEVAGRYNEPLPPVGNEDPGNGLLGAVAMLMALLHRQRHGEGQYVENPQLNATMAHMSHVVRTVADEVIGAGRLDTFQVGVSALERIYRTGDGWVCVAAAGKEDLAAMSKVLGFDILADPRFADEAARRANDEDLSGVLESLFAGRTTQELVSELGALGVAVAAPVGANVHALMNDPEQRSSGRIAEVEHPNLGRVREIGRLVRVSGSLPVPHRLAPELGEHTSSILRWLGYDDEAIQSLKGKGTIK